MIVSELSFLVGISPIILMVIGITTIIATNNNFKKLLGLTILQTAIIMIFLLIGYVSNSKVPIYIDLSKLDHNIVFSNPLPQVLMLTAIVVGIATYALGLSLIIIINKARNAK